MYANCTYDATAKKHETGAQTLPYSISHIILTYKSMQMNNKNLYVMHHSCIPFNEDISSKKYMKLSYTYFKINPLTQIFISLLTLTTILKKRRREFSWPESKLVNYNVM